LAVSRPSADAGRARLLFAATIAGIALYVVLDAVAQSLPPHYSAISQAESDLAVGPYGYIMAVNFVNRGVFSLLFLRGLMKSLPSKPGFRSGFILFGVWAVGALILAVAPTDVNPPATLHGTVHLAVATLAFLGAAFGVLSLSRAFGVDPTLKDLRRYSMPLAVLAAAGFFVLYGAPFVFSHAAAHVGGLLERVFLGLVLTWMLVVSVLMLSDGQTTSNE
jgi:hypothetical protein